MTTLTSRLNIKYGNAKDSVNSEVWKSMNAYDTLCLICAELNINLSNVNDVDFETCAEVIESFKKNANDLISVWFD